MSKIKNVKVNEEAFEKGNKNLGKKFALGMVGGVVLSGALFAALLFGKSKNDNKQVVVPEVPTTTSSTLVEVNAVEVYNANVCDDITDNDKVNARVESIYGDIYNAVKETKYENVLDVYTTDTLNTMFNYFNDGVINGYQSGDSLEMMNLVDGLTNLEGELNVVLPLYKFQLDNTFGQKVAKATYDARVKMMNGQNDENQTLAEKGVSQLASNLYETIVMPGLNGAISVTSLESAGSKAFNLKYIMASDALAQEVNDQVVILDDCGEELSYADLHKAVNEGVKLPGHVDKISVPLNVEGGCVEITYLSSYCMGADQEMLIKQVNQEQVRK